MSTPIQTPRKQQRNPRKSSIPLKETTNLLHRESKNIVPEYSSMMIAEQIGVTSPAIESSIASVEILDRYFCVPPKPYEIVPESPSVLIISPDTEEIQVTSPVTESSIETAEILDCDILVSPTTDALQNLVYSTQSSPSAASEITAATGMFKNLEFSDDSTLSASSEIVNSSVNVSQDESEAISSDSKMKMEKNKCTDSNRLNSLIKIGYAYLKDDISELMCVEKLRVIGFFVLMGLVLLVTLFWKSSSSGVSCSTPPPT